MSPTFFRVTGFVGLLGAVFIYLGWTVTDIQGVGTVVVGEGISPERGESIFWDTGPVKGTCRNCHSIGERGSMTRCPDLGVSNLGPLVGERAGLRAAQRQKETGKPYTPTDYLVECLANPSAFLVEGFPDNLMPLVYTGQVDLEPEDVMAVIAYLQSLGGEVDVRAIQESMSRYGQPILKKASLRGKASQERAGPRPEPAWEILTPVQNQAYSKLSVPERQEYVATELTPDQQEELGWIEEEWYEAVRDVFGRLKCWQCHTVEGEEFGPLDQGNVGPELTAIGAIQTRDYLIESIVNPNGVIVPPLDRHATADGRSKMADFTELMSAKELDQLVRYLERLSGVEASAETDG